MINPSPLTRVSTPGRQLAGKIATALLCVMAFFAIAEWALMATGFSYQPRPKILAVPDRISGFVGTKEFLLETVAAPPGYLWVTRGNTEFTDRDGFRLPEIPFEKAPDKVRVAFLGGSTTQGGYRPYPERAIRLLNRVAGREAFEALNVACSSYSTHQSLMALHRWVLPRKPDIVFVYHGWNDVMVAPDGYADKRKDRLAGAGGKAHLSMPGWMKERRITGLLARWIDAFGPPWPEQRVSFADITHHLETIAAACASNNIQLIVMLRPGDDTVNAASITLDPSGPTARFARNTYGTDDPVALYMKQWKDIKDAQRAVTNRFPEVTLFDGSAVVSAIATRAARGDYGERIPVFLADHIHLFDFADELLAQQVAMVIAPDSARMVSNHIGGISYLTDLAHDLLALEAPREAAWCLRMAIAMNQDKPENSLYHQMLLQKAESMFEFADLFRDGRWGGFDRNIDRKLAKLKRCLELRPTDFGVMAQIYRVCTYSGRSELIADAIAAYQPQSREESIQYLQAMVESLTKSGRTGEARTFAMRLLTMNPKSEQARKALEITD